MGQWSAKLTFHFNLALGGWVSGRRGRVSRVGKSPHIKSCVCLDMSTLSLFAFLYSKQACKLQLCRVNQVSCFFLFKTDKIQVPNYIDYCFYMFQVKCRISIFDLTIFKLVLIFLKKLNLRHTLSLSCFLTNIN